MTNCDSNNLSVMRQESLKRFYACQNVNGINLKGRATVCATAILKLWKSSPSP